MKQIAFTFFLFLAIGFSSSVTAQNKPTNFQGDSLANLKPLNGDIGFGLKANGLKGLLWENNFDSLTIQIRKVKDQKIVFRGDLSIAYSSVKFSEENKVTSGRFYDESKERRFAIGLAPGIERHFRGTRRLDPYIGAALSIAFVGKTKLTEIDDWEDNDGSFNKEETEITSPGGLGFGLDGILGLNYFVADRISLGIEYSLGLTLLRIKGNYKEKTTERYKATPTSGVETEITESDEEIRFTTTNFGNKGVAGLNLIFYLGK